MKTREEARVGIEAARQGARESLETLRGMDVPVQVWQLLNELREDLDRSSAKGVDLAQDLREARRVIKSIASTTGVDAGSAQVVMAELGEYVKEILRGEITLDTHDMLDKLKEHGDTVMELL